ncbi:MAG: transposase [Anaerolineales bacterium]|nr:transposase [Anaerolineales bacterium]
MKSDPQKHHRRSIRLKGYDYSQAGAYFVTIVAWRREMLFGEIVDGEMILNRNGRIVQEAWFDLKRHYRYVALGAFIIMPNHAHGIIVLVDDGRRGGSPISGKTNLLDESRAGIETSPTKETRPYVKPKPRHGLPEIVRAFKSFSARRINRLRRTDGIPVWQRNYYEHIIRNDREMDNITRYIESNPLNWVDDDENPNHVNP